MTEPGESEVPGGWLGGAAPADTIGTRNKKFGNKRSRIRVTEAGFLTNPSMSDYAISVFIIDRN